MLSLARCASKMLLLESSNIEELEEYLIKDFSAIKCDIDAAFRKSNEDSIIIFLLDEINKIVRYSDAKSILIVQKHSDIFLSQVINDKKYELLNKMRIAPVMIIMRTFGDTEKIISKIQENHQCEVGDVNSLLQEHSTGSLIVFTQSPLGKPLTLSDLYEKGLFINEDHNFLLEEFRIRGLEYLNAGIDNKDWYELEIKIYDRYSQYKLHYNRLLKVLENLELGLILGECWGKDSALFFLQVEIYRVRLFTLYEPQYIKKILLGLEHLDDGTRIVDYDLFYRRKKVHWTDVKDEIKGDRIKLSKKYREKIFSQLNESETKAMLKLEEEILKTRY